LKHTAIERRRYEVPLRGTQILCVTSSPTEWGFAASAPNSRVVYDMVLSSMALPEGKRNGGRDACGHAAWFNFDDACAQLARSDAVENRVQHRDFSLFMLAGFFWLFALMIALVGTSIVAVHFDLMQMGHSPFDVATYSAGRVCLALMGVFFFGWLLVSVFRLRSEGPRK